GPRGLTGQWSAMTWCGGCGAEAPGWAWPSTARTAWPVGAWGTMRSCAITIPAPGWRPSTDGGPLHFAFQNRRDKLERNEGKRRPESRQEPCRRRTGIGFHRSRRKRAGRTREVMAMPSRERIMEALSKVHDPELHKSLVDLNMIRALKIDGDRVSVTVALTIQGCPLKGEIQRMVEEAILSVPGVAKADVTLT